MNPTYLHPARGHYCLYEERGESCPGPSGCSTVAAEVTNNPTDTSGTRDGVRCAGCKRWAIRAEDLRHLQNCLALPPPPKARKPRWNPLLGRRV